LICLDKNENYEIDVEQFLHGGKMNYYNRWYDSTLQFIINDRGDFGLSYEHSVCEGIPIVNMAQQIKKTLKNFKTKDRYYFGMTPVASRNFKLSSELTTALLVAEHNILNLQSNLDLNFFRFSNFGKDFIKRQNMSPDAFIQLALQLSYYEIYSTLCSTYESASIRRFKSGRVDNIRAATGYALQFCKHIHDGSNEITSKSMDHLMRAIRFQTQNTQLAITGRGIDNHLLGIERVAHESGIEIPEIFSDKNFQTFNYFKLSTSQVYTNSSEVYMCYGPVVPDGYGCCYNPIKDEIIFIVSSFKDCETTSSSRFVKAINNSLQTMATICNRFHKRRTSSLENISNPNSKPQEASDVPVRMPRIRSNSQGEVSIDLKKKRERLQRAATQLDSQVLQQS